MALARIQLGSAVTTARFLFARRVGSLKSVTSSATSVRHRSSPSSSNGDQWDLYAALCLQRTPMIGPELNWLERRLNEYLTKVEIADSLYSDHEMRHFEDL